MVTSVSLATSFSSFTFDRLANSFAPQGSLTGELRVISDSVENFVESRVLRRLADEDSRRTVAAVFLRQAQLVQTSNLDDLDGPSFVSNRDFNPLSNDHRELMVPLVDVLNVLQELDANLSVLVGFLTDGFGDRVDSQEITNFNQAKAKVAELSERLNRIDHPLLGGSRLIQEIQSALRQLEDLSPQETATQAFNFSQIKRNRPVVEAVDQMRGLVATALAVVINGTKALDEVFTERSKGIHNSRFVVDAAADTTELLESDNSFTVTQDGGDRRIADFEAVAVSLTITPTNFSSYTRSQDFLTEVNQALKSLRSQTGPQNLKNVLSTGSFLQSNAGTLGFFVNFSV